MSRRRQPGGPRSQTPNALRISMKPSSHGHGSADFHRRMPSEWRLKVAAFQHAWPSAPGTCILSCAEAIEETEPPVGGGGFAGFTSAASPQTESSWRSQTSCAASLAVIEVMEREEAPDSQFERLGLERSA